MNQILVVYDKDGKILMQLKDISIKPRGLMYMLVDVPVGKMVIGIDVEKKEAIFADKPKTKEDILNETILVLKDKVAKSEYALMMGGLL